MNIDPKMHRYPTEEFMAHTHEYDCIVCGAHFDSQNDLDRHNRDRHLPENVREAAYSEEPVGNERLRGDEPQRPDDN